MVKLPPGNERNIRDTGLIPEWGRFPGEEQGNPAQYSCLENPRDGGAWWAAVYGVAQSQTRLKRLSRSSICIYVYVYVCVCVYIYIYIVVVVVQSPSHVDSLRPHGLQHTRLSCPLPSPRVCPSSWTLNW